MLIASKSKDARDIPVYQPAEAALYLGIPESTLRSWIKGPSPVLQCSDPSSGLLSFFDLVEAHVLLATRKKHRVPMGRVRAALEYVRKKYPSPHALITEDFFQFGKNLFVEKLGELINASKGDQLAFMEILEQHLSRIERDKLRIPVRLYPFRKGDTPEDKPSIVIDPSLSSGRPVVSGTGVLVSILWDRKRSGESVEALADDYGISSLEIQKAIDYIAAA